MARHKFVESVFTYEVVVVKGTTSETLVYDKDGNFVQKLALNDAMDQLRK